MAGPVSKAVVGLGRTLRELGAAFLGAKPALRSLKGTYGTQRTESREQDEQRRAKYPRD